MQGTSLHDYTESCPLLTPSRFSLRMATIHIYNRGVEKRIIYKDTQDYGVFLRYLKDYLSPPPDLKDLKTIINVQGTSFKGVSRQPKNYHQKIVLIAYCLMPNHFHLLLQQQENRVLENFMRSLITRYCIYFNKKYDRVGPLFQGIYKAVLITEDSHLLHLSRYIHLNPSEFTKSLINAYSSYPDYLKLRNTVWLNPNPVMKFFENKVIPEIKKFNKYKDFVEKYRKDSTQTLRKLILE